MERDATAIVQGILDHWSRGDFRATAGLLSEDVESIWGEPPGDDIVCHGPAEVARRFGEFLANWSEFRVEAQELIPLDDANVLVLGIQRGKGAASALEIEAHVHIVFKLSGEQIAGTYWFFDRETALRAAGLDESDG